MREYKLIYHNKADNRRFVIHYHSADEDDARIAGERIANDIGGDVDFIGLENDSERESE